MRYPVRHALILCVAAICVSGWGPSSTARGQDAAPQRLRLSGLIPGGISAAATESWGTFDFNLTNHTDQDRQARVMMFFDGRPNVQYGRDVWVPARSSLSTWMLTGPAHAQHSTYCDIQSLLYDRTDGTDRFMLPHTEERIRSRGVLFRKPEPYTAILLDEEALAEMEFGKLPQPESRADEALHLVRTFRHSRELSQLVHTIQRSLPPMPDAMDGLNHFVLASARIAHDPVGMQTLRRWLQQGGTVWVMLDMVETDVLAPLLGDALDFHVVDRVSLSHFAVASRSISDTVAGEILRQEHERPVDFVRVLLPSGERAQHTIDGWPTWFTRQVGRGKVVVTTLGARGWYRPRTRQDGPSRFQNFPAVPVPTTPLVLLGEMLHGAETEKGFSIGSFRPLLSDEIGFAVVTQRTMVVIFTAFVLAAGILGFALRKSRRPELLGLLGPAAALGAAVVVVILGETSRRATPPTVAVAQVVDAVSGQNEAAVHGLLAVYRPDSGLAPMGVQDGGFFDIDVGGLDGETRRLIVTDLDAWHWDNLKLPAGVRLAPFRQTIKTGEPIAARARFGPRGLEGRLTAGSLQNLGDAILKTPAGRNVAVQLEPNGLLRAGAQDILPIGKFLAGAVLNDRQQRRQELYGELLKHPLAAGSEDQPVLLAWADPLDMHFAFASGAHVRGSALLVVPLEYERSLPGERITIPGPFVSYRRLREGSATRPTLQSHLGTDMHLRFQLPATVLPFQVERARLALKIDAPTRSVTLAGQADGVRVELHRAVSPQGAIAIDIAEERLLRLDQGGGLHLNVSLSQPLHGSKKNIRATQEDEKWTIDYLELEVTGRRQ